MTNFNTTIKTLRDELTLQTRHCKLLEAQQRALLACDRAKFNALEEDYARLLVQLEAQDTARQAALKDEQGRALTLAALKQAAPEAMSRILDTLEAELRPLLERVQNLNQRNRMLIQNELDYFAFSLDLFVEAGRAACNGYGGYGALGSRMLMDRCA